MQYIFNYEFIQKKRRKLYPSQELFLMDLYKKTGCNISKQRYARLERGDLNTKINPYELGTIATVLCIDNLNDMYKGVVS